jgi:2-methylcitrate dehydratase PrpD
MGKRENADGAYWRPRRFVADVSFERLAAESVDVARVGFIDCIATMIAGAGDPAPQLLRKALRPGHGDASLYFNGEAVPASEAAWINGTAGHALDYDDVAPRGHPSTVLVPAILAEGEALHTSGRDMLAAYVAGYETCAGTRLVRPGSSPPQGLASDWHFRADWCGSGLRIAAPPRRGARKQRARAGRVAEQRCHG